MERPESRDPEAVRDYFRSRFIGEVTHSETGERLNMRGAGYEEVEELDLTGLYEHYKSTPEQPKYYWAGSVKREIEMGECFVIYIPLYADAEVYARPLRLFTGSVTVAGETVPRFRYVGEM